MEEFISAKVTHGKPNEIFSLIISVITKSTGSKINFEKVNDEITKKEISKFLNIDLTNLIIPKLNFTKPDEENKNYVSEIKNFYNQTLDNDYKYFLQLYKEYKDKNKFKLS